MVSPVVHSEEDNSELQGFCSEKGRQSWRLRLQMLFSSPCQVCPGDRLPKYLGHLHLPHMGVERSDLPVGEHTLLELRLCMGTKMFLNLRCSGVARAWYQAGEPIQIHKKCSARCERQREKLCIRSFRGNICRKHYVNISSWYEMCSLWQCLCHPFIHFRAFTKTKNNWQEFLQI